MNDKSPLFNSAMRYLGLMDRNPLSPTYGCADRSYWHYLDAKGFPVDSFQAGILGLHLAGELYSNPTLIELANAGLDRWTKRVLNVGMLDEYFPNQKSFCATAYTTMAASAVLYYRQQSKMINREDSIRAIQKALRLMSEDDSRPKSANQSLAAQVALDVANEHLGCSLELPEFHNLKSNFDDLREYGGFDLAYSLKCLDLSVLALSILSDPKKRDLYTKIIEKILGLISFISEYGFHPGLSSRGNPQQLIGGLSRLSIADPRIEVLLKFVKGIPELVPAQIVDDKYLSFFHLNSLAIGEFSKDISIAQTLPKSFDVKLPPEDSLRELGLYFYKNEKSRLVISTLRGGSFLFTDSDRRIFCNGAILKSSKGFFCPNERSSATLDASDSNINLNFSVQPLKSKVLFLQSFWGSFLIKGILKTPFLATLFRRWIYLKSVKPSSLNLRPFSIQFSFSDGKFLMTQKIDSHFEFVALNHGWVFTDGHATRALGYPTSLFEFLK